MSHAEWIELARLVLEILGAVSTILVALFGWMHWSLRKEMVTKAEMAVYRNNHDEEHDELAARVAKGEARFTKMETLLASLPTKDDVADLRIKMERLSGDIRVVTAVIHRVEQPVRDIVSAALDDRS